jgi:hypothetical protein
MGDSSYKVGGLEALPRERKEEAADLLKRIAKQVEVTRHPHVSHIRSERRTLPPSP